MKIRVLVFIFPVYIPQNSPLLVVFYKFFSCIMLYYALLYPSTKVTVKVTCNSELSLFSAVCLKAISLYNNGVLGFTSGTVELRADVFMLVTVRP